ncbi:MAG: cadherin-like beta sandwich domain-containing protein [Eubacterium sp.]|nr:cadherin-like beta sandwich domain-containing protein [Eubacterium sp.]
MKNRFKKITSIILSFAFMVIMALNTGTGKAHAASASMYISLSSGSVNVGDSVTVYVSISADGYVACDVYVSYDASLLQGSGSVISIAGDGGGSGSLSFVAIASGEAYISASAEGYDLDTNALSIADQGASVTILDPSATTTEATTETTTEATTETTKENTEDTTTEATTKSDLSDNNNLSSLFVEPGKLEPAFSSYTTEYDVQLETGTKSIKVNPVVEDNKASVSVSGNDELEEGMNIVKIIVTAENGAYKSYILNVRVGEDLGDPVATIDGKKYDIVEDMSIDPPEGFTESTVKYEKWTVKAYESPSKKVKVICLAVKNDVEGEDGKSVETWYYIDEKDGYLKKYQEYSSEAQRYVIVDYPSTSSFMLPDFTETELKLGDQTYKAYVSNTDKNIYLVYAFLVDGGDAWYYLYDAKEKNFMRYVELTPTTEATTEVTTQATTEKVNTIVIDNTKKVEDKGFFSKKNLKIMLIGMTAMFLLLCIATIILVIRLGNAQNKDDDKDDEKQEKIEKRTKKVDYGEEETPEIEKESDEFFDDPEKAYKEAQVVDEYPEGTMNGSEEYAEQPAETAEAENYSEGAEADEQYYEEAEAADAEYSNEEYSDAEYSDAEYSEAGNAEEYAETGYAEETAAEYAEEYVQPVNEPAYADGIMNDSYEAESYAAQSYSEPTPIKKYDGGVTGKIDYSEVIEATEVTASGLMADDYRPSKVTDDTIGIQLEDAIDNNSSVNVPPVAEESAREAAMKTRPYGIDSAFDVIEEEKYREIANEAEQNTTDISDVISDVSTERLSANSRPVSSGTLNQKPRSTDPTVSAAAAAFANIKKNVEESLEDTVQTKVDDDIVFPTGNR